MHSASTTPYSVASYIRMAITKNVKVAPMWTYKEEAEEQTSNKTVYLTCYS